MQKLTRGAIGILLLAAVLTLGHGAAFAAEYPVMAECTGDNVRLRENPSTDAKIVGKADSYQTFMALGETSVDGEVWYEVDLPKQKGTAWVFGKFLNVNYFKETYDEDITPARRLSWKVGLTFGGTLDKARLLFGKPQKETKKITFIEGAGKKLPDVTLVYPTHTAQYVDDGLTMVKVTKGTMPFGELRIGDPASTVADLLGEPFIDGELLSYELGPVEYLNFTVKDDKITALEYTSWFD